MLIVFQAARGEKKNRIMVNVVKQVKRKAPHYGHNDSTGPLLDTLWPHNYWNCLVINGGAGGTEGAIVAA